MLIKIIMLCNCVMYHASLIGVYTSAVDANRVQRMLPNSTVQECHLNNESVLGSKLIQAPA